MRKLFAVLLLLTFATAAWDQELPDAPQPKVPASRMTRQDRDAYLCAKYGCDKPVKTLKEAVTTPLMLSFEGGLIASFIFDEEGTQHCIANHTCREANPILGQSRTQAYPVGAALLTANILAAGYLRKEGHGSLAYALLWVPTVVHIDLGTYAWRRQQIHGTGKP